MVQAEEDYTPQSDFLRRLRSSQETIFGQLFRAARGAEAVIDRYTMGAAPAADRLIDLERMIVGGSEQAEGIIPRLVAYVSEYVQRLTGNYKQSHLSGLEEAVRRLPTAQLELLERRIYGTRDELLERYKEIQTSLGGIAIESQKLEEAGRRADTECTALEADIANCQAPKELAELKVEMVSKLQEKGDIERMLGQYGRKAIFYDNTARGLLQYIQNLSDLLDMAESERSMAADEAQHFNYIKASEKANVRLALSIATMQDRRQEFHARMDKLNTASVKARVENSRLITRNRRYTMFTEQHLEQAQAVNDTNHRERNYQNMKDYEAGKEALDRR